MKTKITETEIANLRAENETLHTVNDTPQKLTEAAELLAAHGICFFYNPYGGWNGKGGHGGNVFLEPHEVAEVLDPEAFFARSEGVSREHLQRWRIREADGWQCTALARTTGKRCLSYMHIGGYNPSPREYSPEQYDLCAIHRDLDGVREAEVDARG